MAMKAAKKALWVVVTIVLLLPLVSSFYKYYYTKDYDFLIEAKCDPEKENCYLRDCSTPDDCPPNGYSTYKQFSIKAFDFVKCAENSCTKECEERIITCIDIPCGGSEEDACSESL